MEWERAHVSSRVVKEILKKMNEAAGEYVSQVHYLHKSGLDLMHLMEHADESVRLSFTEFEKVSEPLTHIAE